MVFIVQLLAGLAKSAIGGAVKGALGSSVKNASIASVAEAAASKGGSAPSAPGAPQIQTQRGTSAAPLPETRGNNSPRNQGRFVK